MTELPSLMTYTGKVKRRNANAYCDEVTDNTRGICSNCYDDNITVKLEKYEPDNHFLQCHLCKKIYNKNRTKYSSIVEPLGTVKYG